MLTEASDNNPERNGLEDNLEQKLSPIFII